MPCLCEKCGKVCDCGERYCIYCYLEETPTYPDSCSATEKEE